ncbi:MAG TPA: hypothetical protein VMH86_11405 [Rhizomicrobium sp.]|nr:hypothetical protein [Rhizomicrobium sp.]
MEFEQSVRAQWRAVRAHLAELWTRAGLSAGRAAEAGRDAIGHPRAGPVARIALGAVLVLFVLYPALAWWHSTIDDDLAFTGKAPRPGMSHAVAAAAALISREIHKNGWTANAPWFSPYALLDDMPNYQTGIVEALANVVYGLNDRKPDDTLEAAGDLLHYRPDAWLWNSSASQYRLGARDLREFNARLASGQAALDRSAPALAGLLDRVAADLDATSATLSSYVSTESGWPFDTGSDDLFYRAKGRLYAYDIVLHGLGADYSAALAARGLTRQWSQMLQAFDAAAHLRPWMVMNGAPDSALFACTLCGEGFYVERARDEMRAIHDSLMP